MTTSFCLYFMMSSHLGALRHYDSLSPIVQGIFPLFHVMLTFVRCMHHVKSEYAIGVAILFSSTAKPCNQIHHFDTDGQLLYVESLKVILLQKSTLSTPAIMYIYDVTEEEMKCSCNIFKFKTKFFTLFLCRCQITLLCSKLHSHS